MIVDVITVQLKPGKRVAGLEQLQKLGQMFSDKYNTFSRVLISVSGGPIYDASLVTVHDGLAQKVARGQELVADEAFQSWFAEASVCIEWPTSSSETYNTHRVPNFPDDWDRTNYTLFVSVDLIPGKWDAGQAHMSKLADLLERKYGLPTSVSTSLNGVRYRHYWAVSYPSLERYEEVDKALESDEEYRQWAAEAVDLMKLETAEMSIGQYL